MSVVGFFIAAGKLALVAIILWFVCELLPMPSSWKRMCQALIVLLAILGAIDMVLASDARERINRPLPSITAPPSIMAPEKR